MKQLTETEKKILNYLKNNIEIALKIGVRGVAKENYTSTSTIMRMAKKLGYSGFVELIYSFHNTPIINKEKEATKIDFSTTGIFFVRNENEKYDFLKNLKNGTIAVYGEGFSGFVSQYIYQKFLVIGVKALHIIAMDPKAIQRNGLNIDMILIISKSGENPNCYSLCENFKNRGIKIASFTGRKLSKIAKISDYSFVFEDEAKIDEDLYYPNPFFGYCIVGFEELIRSFFIITRKSETC